MAVDCSRWLQVMARGTISTKVTVLIMAVVMAIGVGIDLALASV